MAAIKQSPEFSERVSTACVSGWVLMPGAEEPTR